MHYHSVPMQDIIGRDKGLHGAVAVVVEGRGDFNGFEILCDAFAAKIPRTVVVKTIFSTF